MRSFRVREAQGKVTANDSAKCRKSGRMCGKLTQTRKRRRQCESDEGASRRRWKSNLTGVSQRKCQAFQKQEDGINVKKRKGWPQTRILTLTSSVCKGKRNNNELRKDNPETGLRMQEKEKNKIKKSTNSERSLQKKIKRDDERAISQSWQCEKLRELQQKTAEQIHINKNSRRSSCRFYRCGQTVQIKWKTGNQKPKERKIQREPKEESAKVKELRENLTKSGESVERKPGKKTSRTNKEELAWVGKHDVEQRIANTKPVHENQAKEAKRSAKKEGRSSQKGNSSSEKEEINGLGVESAINQDSGLKQGKEIRRKITKKMSEPAKIWHLRRD